MAEPVGRKAPGPRGSTLLLGGIFTILLTAALRLGAGLLLPIAIAILFTLLLDPMVRGLGRLRVPHAIGAALVVFGTLGAVSAGVGMLAGPAAELVQDAPDILSKVQRRIRKMIRPIQETAQKVEQATETAKGPPTVKLQTPGLLQRLTGGTVNIIGAIVTVVFLTYFMLASLPMLKQKMANLIQSRSSETHVENLLTEIETQMSRYMFINTLTSLGVGLATYILLLAVGMPNPLLWGVVAFLLNYVPYAGALVTVVIIGAIALVSFEDTGRFFIVVGGFIGINLIEGNLVTPHLMGQHLPLNPVAIFVSLLYWGWVWGPVGALLAVPLTVLVQVAASRIEGLKGFGSLLNN